MNKLILIAGPCVVESEETTMQVAEHLVKICKNLPIELIFKASYRKANRSRLASFTGIGDFKALKILAKVHDEFGIAVTTDIHEVAEAAEAAKYVQVIQIPAFLCRQTELLLAAARTGLPVNIKKGQFMSPQAMSDVVDKIAMEIVKHFSDITGFEVVGKDNRSIAITERGNSFGYNDVVIDMRNIKILHTLCPNVFVDITHTNGGHPIQSFALGRAAVAAGADGIFLETHPDPDNAKSDGKNMIPLHKIEEILKQFVRIKEAIQ